MTRQTPAPPESCSPRTAPAGSPAVACAPTADSLLQLSRRLDWRFLMPSPDLENVAWLGPPAHDLVEPLRAFSRRLLVAADPSKDRLERERWDLVVAVRPCLTTLTRAAELARANGWLYVEVDRRLSGSRGGLSPTRPADWLACLREAGFADAQAYCHWPDFSSCTEIISLEDRAAMRCLLGRWEGGPRRWAKAAGGRLLLAAGLLPRFLPCYSILAQKEGP